MPPAAVELSALRSTSPGVPPPRRKHFFTVTGMTCAACSGTIERALRTVKGVHSAKVSLLTERCEVVFDEAVLTPAQIVSEIEDVGFEASVSAAGAKGRVSLLTEEHMSADKRAVITRAVMEQVGVTNVSIVPRAVPPHHDVIEIEFDAKQHELSGPGGKKPVVWQGTPPPPTTQSAATSNGSPSSAPHSTPAAPGSSSSPGPDSLGRFSIRTCVSSLQQQYCVRIHVVRTDGDLESRKAEMRHRREEELRTWRQSFLRSLLFTVPIAVVCWILPFIPLFHDSLMASVHRALTVKALILWLLVTPVQFGFGWRFYRNAYKALRHRAANMDVLVSLGSSAAYFYSLIVCIMCLANDHYEGNVFFETSALLISIVLLGRYVESVAKGRTSEALSVLMGLQAATATLLKIHALTGEVEGEEEIDVNLVQADDVLLVQRGGKIPVDGIIVSPEGTTTAVDESLLTGESMPVVKGPGATVIGGTINLEQPIRVRATGVGSDTVLYKIVSLVNDAQSSKAPIQAYADYIATLFVPAVVGLAIVVFILWFILGATGVVPTDWKGEHENDFLFAFLFAVSVLLISCPCSLGLATPTAVMVGTGVGAQLGVLFKGGEPLEITGRASAVVFDKTGTLTAGKPSVSAEHCRLLSLNELRLGEEAWWGLVGALAHQSEHMMSRAIAAHAKQVCGGTGVVHHLASVDKFEAQSGAGCAGVVNGKRVLLGNARWMLANGLPPLSAEANAHLDSVQRLGQVTVLAAIDGRLAGLIALSDSVKPEAPATVRALHARGIQVFMLTGDNARSAQAVGLQVGIPAERVFAQVTPGEKAEIIARLQEDLNPHSVAHAHASAAAETTTADAINARSNGNGAAASNGVNGNSTSSTHLVSVPSSPNKHNRKSSLLDHAPRASDEGDYEDDDGFSSSSSHAGRHRPPGAPIVLFVGDGINDSVALARADAGVAIGSGTDIAVETASVVLMRSDLTDVLTAVDLSQATLRRIRANFTWACIYNVLSIPVAAGAFFPLVHVTLPPILAAACMGLSSISVIASSLLLKNYRKPVVPLSDDDMAGVPQSPKPRPLMGRVPAALLNLGKGGVEHYAPLPVNEDAVLPSEHDRPASTSSGGGSPLSALSLSTHSLLAPSPAASSPSLALPVHAMRSAVEIAAEQRLVDAMHDDE